MIKRFFFLLIFFTQMQSFAQNPRAETTFNIPPDTVHTSSTQKDTGFARVVFSDDKAKLKQLINQASINEKKEQRRKYTRIILGAVLLTIVIIGIIPWIRNRKQ